MLKLIELSHRRNSVYSFEAQGTVHKFGMHGGGLKRARFMLFHVYFLKGSIILVY